MQTYCLDTNIYITPWTEYYSIELCPDFWEKIDELAQKNIVFSPIEVRTELERCEDDLFKWVKSRQYIFRDIDADIQPHLKRIMAKFPTFIEVIKGHSMADPWVVAQAMKDNAVVVTKEDRAKTPRKVKIPDVCAFYGIRCINDFQFMKEVGIKLSATI